MEVERAPPVVERLLQERLAHHDAGVGDERVDAVEPFDAGPGRIRVGEIDATRALGGLDAPAIATQALRSRQPDTAARTGAKPNGPNGHQGGAGARLAGSPQNPQARTRAPRRPAEPRAQATAPPAR